MPRTTETTSRFLTLLLLGLAAITLPRCSSLYEEQSVEPMSVPPPPQHPAPAPAPGEPQLLEHAMGESGGVDVTKAVPLRHRDAEGASRTTEQFSTGSFVTYPDGTQGGAAPPQPASAQSERALRRAPRRTMGDQRNVASAAEAFNQGEASSLQLALADYDEVWVIARKTGNGPAPNPTRDDTGLCVRRPDGSVLPFPLQETRVEASVDGRLSDVLVTQSYANPYEETIEAVYVFPLPSDSAVSDFVMSIGERRIRGIVRERGEAERVYHEARSSGHAASLLTQERPNIFTQRVANIDPGREIDVELRYFAELPRRDGWYELVFPTVVGPRFNPPGSTQGVGAVPRGAHGSSGQATEVQYLAPGERTGARFALSVDLDTGLVIEELESPSHLLTVDNLGEGRRRIEVADRADAANRDFVLRWRVAGDELKTALLRHEEKGEGWFSLLLEPPAELADLRRQPMEWVFVLDCSGSMRGEPMAIAKRAVKRVLGDLEPNDSFQIIRFSSSSSSLGPAPLVATAGNVRRGLRYIEGLSGSGGTHMIEGIKAALDFPHDPERYRMVVFLTDGYIGNEGPILTEIHRRLGEARIFSFGVGSSPNRYLLDRMARLGRGAVAWVGPNAEVSEAEVNAFLDRVTRPALTDVELDFGGAEVAELFPSRIPDVFHGRPVSVTGRYSGELPEVVRIRGRAGGHELTLEIDVDPRASTERPALQKVWARSKIRQLARRGLELGQGEAVRDEILQVALAHGLASDHTAFVAVDSLTRTSSTHGTTVVQPVPVPAGVRYDTTVSTSQR